MTDHSQSAFHMVTFLFTGTYVNAECNISRGILSFSLSRRSCSQYLRKSQYQAVFYKQIRFFEARGRGIYRFRNFQLLSYGTFKTSEISSVLSDVVCGNETGGGPVQCNV